MLTLVVVRVHIDLASEMIKVTLEVLTFIVYGQAGMMGRVFPTVREHYSSREAAGTGREAAGTGREAANTTFFDRKWPPRRQPPPS